jgi:hypothetical protein
MGPLLSGVMSNVSLTCGKWSPTRPGVFYIGRADGVIEVWDIIDKSHAASSTQNISPSAISSIQIHYYPGGKGQFISAGDDDGTLHILETPKSLYKPGKNEVHMFNIESRS